MKSRKTFKVIFYFFYIVSLLYLSTYIDESLSNNRTESLFLILSSLILVVGAVIIFKLLFMKKKEINLGGFFVKWIFFILYMFSAVAHINYYWKYIRYSPYTYQLDLIIPILCYAYGGYLIYQTLFRKIKAKN